MNEKPITFFRKNNYKSIVIPSGSKASLDHFKYKIQSAHNRKITFPEMFEMLMRTYDATQNTLYCESLTEKVL